MANNSRGVEPQRADESCTLEVQDARILDQKVGEIPTGETQDCNILTFHTNNTPTIAAPRRRVETWSGELVDDEWSNAPVQFPQEPRHIVQPLRQFGASGLCAQWVDENRHRMSSRICPEDVILRTILKPLFPRLCSDVLNVVVDFCASPSLHYCSRWGSFLVRRPSKAPKNRPRGGAPKWVRKTCAEVSQQPESVDSVGDTMIYTVKVDKNKCVNLLPQIRGDKSLLRATSKFCLGFATKYKMNSFELILFDCTPETAVAQNCGVFCLRLVLAGDFKRPPGVKGPMTMKEIIDTDPKAPMRDFIETSDELGDMYERGPDVYAILHTGSNSAGHFTVARIALPKNQTDLGIDDDEIDGSITTPGAQASSEDTIGTGGDDSVDTEGSSTDSDSDSSDDSPNDGASSIASGSDTSSDSSSPSTVVPNEGVGYGIDDLIALERADCKFHDLLASTLREYGSCKDSMSILDSESARVLCRCNDRTTFLNASQRMHDSHEMIQSHWQVIVESTRIFQKMHESIAREAIRCHALDEEKKRLLCRQSEMMTRWRVAPRVSPKDLESVCIELPDRRGNLVRVPSDMLKHMQDYIRGHSDVEFPTEEWINALGDFLSSRLSLVPALSGGETWAKSLYFPPAIEAMSLYCQKVLLPQARQEMENDLPKLGYAAERRFRRWGPVRLLCQLAGVPNVKPKYERHEESQKHFIETRQDNDEKFDVDWFSLLTDNNEMVDSNREMNEFNPVGDKAEAITTIKPEAEVVKQANKRACYNCGSTEHLAKECKSKPRRPKRGAGIVDRLVGRRCYSCGAKGHVAADCKSHASRGARPSTAVEVSTMCTSCRAPCTTSACIWCSNICGCIQNMKNFVTTPMCKETQISAPLILPSVKQDRYAPLVPLDPSVKFRLGQGTDLRSKKRGGQALMPFSTRRYPVSTDCGRQSILVSLLVRQGAATPKPNPANWYDLEILNDLVLYNYRHLSLNQYFCLYSGERRTRIETGYREAASEGWAADFLEFTRFSVFPKHEHLSKATSAPERGLRWADTEDVLTSNTGRTGRLDVQAYNTQLSALHQASIKASGVVLKPRNIAWQGPRLNAYTSRATQSAYWSAHEQWNVWDAMVVLGYEQGLNPLIQLEETVCHIRGRETSRMPDKLPVALVLGSGRNSLSTGNIFAALQVLEQAQWVIGESDYSQYDSTQGLEACATMRMWARKSGLGPKWCDVHRAHTRGVLRSRYGDRLARPGTMKSGTPYTTLQNSVLNAYAVFHCARQLIGPNYRKNIFVAVAGDDLIAAVSPAHATTFWNGFSRAALELGFVAKTKIVELERATFLASQHWPTKCGRVVACPELARCFYKHPWALLHQDKPEHWRRGVTLGLAHCLSPIPLFGKWALDACGDSSDCNLNEQWRGKRYFPATNSLDILHRRYPTLRWKTHVNPFTGPVRALPRDSPIDCVLVDGGYAEGDDP